MRRTGPKIYNGQHQIVSEHHSALRNGWIAPRAEKEKKKESGNTFLQ
jgi:hypothetical protein